MVRKSWPFAHNRRVIELAKAKTSLEEAARIMERTPERIRKVAMRLGVTFKSEKKRKSRAGVSGPRKDAPAFDPVNRIRNIDLFPQPS